jgi:hypothetical protein
MANLVIEYSRTGGQKWLNTTQAAKACLSWRSSMGFHTRLFDRFWQDKAMVGSNAPHRDQSETRRNFPANLGHRLMTLGHLLKYE